MRKIILVIILLFVIALTITLSTYQGDVPLKDISYEEVEAKVKYLNVRTGKSGKYIITHYYDVTVEYNGREYKISFDLEPKYKIGMTYKFYLCDGMMYDSIEKLQRNYSIVNEPFAHKFSSVVTFVTMIVMCPMIFFLIKKRK